MKKVLALFTFSLLAGIYSSSAQTSTNLYWDTNGTTGGIGGTGNWTTTGTNWTTNSAGTASTISGGWTNGANWTNGVANNAILQGTVGTVSLSSTTIFANQIQVNTTGFTIQNSSSSTTSQNRYFRTKNGIVLANGVNLNISSGITTNGAITGFEGPIVGVNGTNSVSTGSSVTITGTTATAETSVRIALDTSTTDVWVPIIVNTTGSGYANISISSSSVTTSLYGDVTVNSGSRLVLGGNNSATTRRINVRGKLSTVNTDLTIGESGGGGIVVMYGTNNSVGGNVVVASGALGFGSTSAFGTSPVLLNNGTVFGATSFGTGPSDRTLPNAISVQGNVTFGLNGQSGFSSGAGSYLGGNINLNNATRTFTITNSTYFLGSITNGGVNLNAGSTTVTAYLNGTNSLSSLSWTNGIISLGSNTNSIGTLTMTGPASGTNTSPSLQLDLGITPTPSTGGSIVITGTNNKIIATNSVTGTAITGTTNIPLLAGTSVDISGLSSNGVVLSGGLVGGTNVSVVLNGPTVIRPDRTTYKFVSTPAALELQVGVSSALDLTWGGVDGPWDTTTQNWNNAGTPINYNTGDNATISSGGTLTIDSAGISAGIVTVSGSTATTLTGGALTAVSLAKTGDGSLSLGMSGNFTQGMIVDAGSVDIGANNQTTTALSVTNGSILGSGTISATSVTATPSDGTTSTIAAALSGTYSFNKNGAGTTVLSGVGSYVGNVNVNAGTLATSGNERIPDSSVLQISNGATFRLGGDESVKGLEASTTTTAVLDLQSHNLVIGVGSTSNNFGGGSIIGTGTVTKVGSGVQSWNSPHTFSGGMTLKSGDLRLAGSGSRSTNVDTGVVTLVSSAFGTGGLNLEGGRIYSSSLTNSTSPGRTIYTPVNIKGDFALGLSNSLGQTGDLTVSTNVSGVVTSLLTNTVFSADSVVEWQQPISGAGFNLTKSGLQQASFRGNLDLAVFTVSQGRADLRASNNLTSVLVANGARLGYGTTNAAMGSAPIQLEHGATLGQVASMGSTTEERTIANPLRVLGNVTFGLGGYGNYFSGPIDLNGASRTLVLGNSTHLFGVVTNGGIVIDNDTGGAGSRSLNLYNENTYEGGTTVKANAILGLGNARALGSGDLTLEGSGFLTNTLALSFTNPIALGAHTLTFDNAFDLGVEGAINGSGGLIKTNIGKLTLKGSLTYAGATTVSAGELRVEKSALTATITPSTVAIQFSAVPSAGDYPVLGGGSLAGTYGSGAVTVTGLAGDQTASFNASSGLVTVAQVPPPANLTYGSSEITGTAGAVFSPVTPTCDHGPTSFTVEPALPTGLGIDPVSGALGGTPLAASARALYTVTASNPAGSTTASFYLTVTSAGPTFENAYPGVNLADVAPNGLTYLVNYAFGGSATNAAKLPKQDATDATKLKLVAYVRTNNTAETITVKGQTGSSLTSWDANLVDGVPAADQSDAPDGTQKQVFSVDASGSRQFLRLKITK